MSGTATGGERIFAGIGGRERKGTERNGGFWVGRESHAAHCERGGRSAGEKFAEEVSSQHGRATILFNNAGVALLGHLEEISLQEFRWLMDINFWGVVYGVTYFLPLLKKEKAGAHCEHVEPAGIFRGFRARGVLRQ